jgi:hypothetical protein
LTARGPTLKLAILERCLSAGPRRYEKRRIFVRPPPFSGQLREQVLDPYGEDILRLQEHTCGDLSP